MRMGNMVEFCRKCGTLLRGKVCACGLPATADQWQRMQNGMNDGKEISQSNEEEKVKQLHIPEGRIITLGKDTGRRKKRTIFRPKPKRK